MIDFSKGYRNITYSPFRKSITLWGWNPDGDRIQQSIPYTPYLYVEHKDATDAISVFGTPLRRIEFKSSTERRKFTDRHPTGRVFHNLSPEQQFLVDNYYHFATQDLVGMPLRVASLDIEVYSPDEFPTADQARHPINVITIHDSLTNQFLTWGTKRFDETRINKELVAQEIPEIDLAKFQYVTCDNEINLLSKFLRWWTKNCPDVVTGWNVIKFDIPYLINRCSRLSGEGVAKTLSPVNSISSRELIDIFGQPYQKWKIDGVSIIDYLELYKTLSRGESESYKLGDVAAAELGISKIAHNAGDLVTLCDTDWDLFVTYNIQDVNLIIAMDAKLKFLDLARFLTVKGLAKTEACMGKIAIVAGAMAATALKQRKVMGTFNRPNDSRGEYEGAYVRDPKRGLHTDVVSFDANSLYPNTIITLNISPETKIGKLIESSRDGDGKHVMVATDHNVYTLTNAKLDQLLRACSLSSAGVLYSQKTQGFVPQFIDSLYADRVAVQTQLAAKESELFEIDRQLSGLGHK